jgi:hypothetical protein
MFSGCVFFAGKTGRNSSTDLRQEDPRRRRRGQRATRNMPVL